MDPNATLKEARAYANLIFEGTDDCNAANLAELFKALDEWIMKGGFLPDAWAKAYVTAVQRGTAP